jgi:hypothetical protein
VPITHTVTTTVRSTGAGGVVTATATATGNTELYISVGPIPAGTTDLLVPLGFTAANLLSAVLSADGSLTVKTNSATTPGNTFAIGPGTPLVWSGATVGATNPFTTTSVTGLYVSTSTAPATFVYRLLTT